MPLRKRLSIACLIVAALCALAAPSAFASSSQVTIMQDNNAINHNPVAALSRMKLMGATLVKYAVYWKYLTPAQSSTRAPAGATNPNLYKPYFGQLIAIDQAAHAVGIKLGFMVTSPAPRWAEGSGCSGSAIPNGTCKPSDADFQAFMTALGQTFSGSAAIPAVRWWSIWNEPNYIPNLAPQTVGASTYEAPDLYRGLVNAGWKGLTGTGHGPASDTILWGDLAPRGIAGSSSFGPANNAEGYKPVAFVADLYCETVSGHRFSGRLASENGCGRSAGAFKAANPALFNASGVADHPYSQGVTPVQRTYDCRLRILGRPQNLFCDATRGHRADPLWTDLASISNLTGALDRAVRAYGSNRRFPIWNTEYGYWTNPPGANPCRSASQTYCALNQNTAAYYLNWAEYVSYRNPRIQSLSQYQLYDPRIGDWRDGLLTPTGAPKATFYAWELPMFLPTTRLAHAGNVTVWGGDRPALADAIRLRGFTPTVAIQFKGARGGWSTIKSVPVNLRSAGGYFTTSVHLSSSGSVRLSYSVAGRALTGRTQSVTVR